MIKIKIFKTSRKDKKWVGIFFLFCLHHTSHMVSEERKIYASFFYHKNETEKKRSRRTHQRTIDKQKNSACKYNISAYVI